jgi:hypothetical protein
MSPKFIGRRSNPEYSLSQGYTLILRLDCRAALFYIWAARNDVVSLIFFLIQAIMLKLNVF